MEVKFLSANCLVTCEDKSGIAEIGPQANLAIVTAKFDMLNIEVTDEDWSHYLGVDNFQIFLPLTNR